MPEIYPSAVCSFFSTNLYNSALVFVELARQVEEKFTVEDRREWLAQHQAYVVGAILSSVSFLEAYVNELFVACSDLPSSTYGLSHSEREQLGRMWRMGIPRTARYSILEKYGIALSLLAKPELEHGNNPTQDAKLLVRLRNALAHFEPEMIRINFEHHPPASPDEVHLLERQLSAKFAHNPLAWSQAAFFPEKCLGYGCARWSTETALAFVCHFVSLAGITDQKSPIEHPFPTNS